MNEIIILPPTRKGEYNSKVNTTHIRVYRHTQTAVKRIADSWNTTQVEVIRYLVELADNGLIVPPELAPAPGAAE